MIEIMSNANIEVLMQNLASEVFETEEVQGAMEPSATFSIT